MILAKPLPTGRGRGATAPVAEAPEPKQLEPIVRIRHASGTNQMGWYLDAQRSEKSEPETED